MDIDDLLCLLNHCGDDTAIAAANNELMALLVEEVCSVALQLTALERGDLVVELAPHGLLDEEVSGASNLTELLAETRVSLSSEAAETLQQQFPPLDVPPPLALEAWAKSSRMWVSLLDVALKRQQPPSWGPIGWRVVIHHHVSAASKPITFCLGTQQDQQPAEEDPTLFDVLSKDTPLSESSPFRYPFPQYIYEVIEAGVSTSWSVIGAVEEMKDELIDKSIDWLQGVVEEALVSKDRQRLEAAQSMLLGLLYNEPDMLEGLCVQQALDHPRSVGGGSMAAVSNPKAVIYALQAPLAQVYLCFSAAVAISQRDTLRAQNLLYWLGVSHPAVLSEEIETHVRPSTPAMRDEMQSETLKTRMKLNLRRPPSAVQQSNSDPASPASPQEPAMRWSQDAQFVGELCELMEKDLLQAAPKKKGAFSLKIRTTSHYDFLKRLVSNPAERHRLAGLGALLAAIKAHNTMRCFVDYNPDDGGAAVTKNLDASEELSSLVGNDESLALREALKAGMKANGEDGDVLMRALTAMQQSWL